MSANGAIPGLAEPLLREAPAKEVPAWRWSDSAVVSIVGVAGPLVAWLQAPDLIVAGLNSAALLLLAIALAAVIELLAQMVGDVHGSLITASLANIVELALSLVALRQGMLRFVQINLLGTVLTSCLLVPGLSFVLRGLSESRDKLNKHAGAMVSMCLLLASLAYSVTTAYNVTSQHKHHCQMYCDVQQVKGISHLVAIVLLLCYAVLLVWSTVTHSHLIAKRRSKYKKTSRLATASLAAAPADAETGDAYNGGGGAITEEAVGWLSNLLKGDKAKAADAKAAADAEAASRTVSTLNGGSGGSTWLLTATILGVLLLTLWVVVCANALLASLDGATKLLGLSRHFAALVLVPNVGGMDAIVTAANLALKGHVDLALSFSVGIAIQILIGVLPVLVLVGWAIGQPLLMDLRAFEAVLLLLCVLVVNGVVRRASATYLEGAMMIGAYLVVALTYFYRSHEEEYGFDGHVPVCICGEACCLPGNETWEVGRVSGSWVHHRLS